MSAGRILYAVAAFCILSAAAALSAPVGRPTALRAADAELPGFFPGQWELEDELVLYDLDLTAAAYTFTFRRSDLIKEQPLELAAEIAGKKKLPPAAPGRQEPAATQPPEHQQYATIVISARDSEPPVIRCFRGQPPQRANEQRALALAREAAPQYAPSTIHHLLLGFFDEAVAIISEDDPDDALVADLRGNRTFPLAEVRERAAAISNAMEPDPERISLSRQAWRKYKTAGRIDGAPLLQSTGGSQ